MRKSVAGMIVVAFAVLLYANRANAHTLGKETFVCPVCDTEFQEIISYSGTSFGMRLDFKRLGPIYQPWPVPQCPNCRFVFLSTSSEDNGLGGHDKQTVREYLDSEEFKAIPAEAPAYFRKAKIMEHLGASPADVAHIYLMASWQSEGAVPSDTAGLALDWPRKPEFIEQSLRECLRCLRAPGGVDEDDPAGAALTAYLQVEVNRRLGNFEDAQTALRNARDEFSAFVATIDAKEAEDYSHLKLMLDEQEKYIAMKNGEPQPFEPEDAK